MASYTISPVELSAEWHKYYLAQKHAVVQGLQEAAFRSMPVVQASARAKGAVNTGEYIRAWKVTKNDKGARLLNDRPYAAVLEKGRRPGKFPPLRMIAMWVFRKLRTTTKTKSGKSVSAPHSFEDVMGIALAIARKMKARGTPAKNIMGSVEPAMTRIAKAEVAKHMNAELSKRPTRFAK